MFSAQNEPDFYTSQSRLFASICSAADKNDVDGLEKLLASGIYINIQHKLHTPTSFLAEKGREQAVKLLLAQGGRLNEAIRGYAMGIEHAKLQPYLNRDHKLIPDAIEGYATIGDDDKVRYWLDRSYSSEGYGSAATGYATGKQSLQLEQELSEKGQGRVVDAIRGAAMVGDEATIDTLIAQAREKNFAIHVALIFSAFGGHDKLVYQLLDKYQAEGAKPESAALGYIRLGHGEQLGKMILRGASPERAVHYYYTHADFPRHKHAIACALRLLTLIPQDDARTKIAAAMQEYVTEKIDFQLGTAANEIRALMKEKHLDFAQSWEKYRESMPYLRRCMFN